VLAVTKVESSLARKRAVDEVLGGALGVLGPSRPCFQRRLNR
jgi:hypothetical protein